MKYSSKLFALDYNTSNIRGRRENEEETKRNWEEEEECIVCIREKSNEK